MTAVTNILKTVRGYGAQQFVWPELLPLHWSHGAWLSATELLMRELHNSDLWLPDSGYALNHDDVNTRKPLHMRCMYFYEGKLTVIVFLFQFHVTCPKVPSWQKVVIGSDNGLAPNRQTITWDPFH